VAGAALYPCVGEVVVGVYLAGIMLCGETQAVLSTMALIKTSDTIQNIGNLLLFFILHL
jgi:hypothetical protein